MLVPVLTTEKVILSDFCPQCGKPLAVKFSFENGMPFIACDYCDYKRELILFKNCPKCGGKMKFIHKRDKFKCNGCNTWYEVKLVENGSEGDDNDFVETLRKRIREIVQEEIKRMVTEEPDFRRMLQGVVTNNVIDSIINALKTYKTI